MGLCRPAYLPDELAVRGFCRYEKTVWNSENMYAFQNQKRLIDDYMIKYVVEHEMLGTMTT